MRSALAPAKKVPHIRGMLDWPRRTAAVLVLVVSFLSGCGPREAPPSIDLPARSEGILPPYEVTPAGGTRATGPGERYNHCERIWCLLHGENFFIDHFLENHKGWILHDDRYGDVFAPRYRSEGPPFREAKKSMLLLCGRHVHPYLFGGGPILHTGYNARLGYGRGHYTTYGTRLEACCINGLGSGFIHSRHVKQFNFHKLDYYRANPEWGWQKPFQVRMAAEAR